MLDEADQMLDMGFQDEIKVRGGAVYIFIYVYCIFVMCFQDEIKVRRVYTYTLCILLCVRI